MTIECPECQTSNPDESKFCNECATPLPSIRDAIHTKTMETPKEELTRGTLFSGRYEIIEELGKGGMGKVYRVEDTKIKKEIALKLIKPEIASDKKTIERFKNELTTAREIAHRNVCRMFDLGEEKGQHFITMEYVSGGDLKKFIRRSGQMGIGKAISIAKQICDGLEEAHSLGIVHRDLKPNNIMIDDNGNARIMDFGIARTVKGKGITGAGVMIGTPEYMSPEQVEAKEVDQRSDIYSLGIIMYEMLTGLLPFEADTPFAVGVKHKSEIPKNPKEFNSQIPDDLCKVILKCLEKERGNRFLNAEEIRAELEKIELDLPTTDRIVLKKKHLTSRELTVQLNLKKLFIPTFSFLLVVVIGLILWSPWSKKEPIVIPSGKPSIAIMYFKNNTGDTNLDHWQTMLANLLIADLTQSKHIRVLSEDKLLNILGQLNQEESRTYSSDVLKRVAAQGQVNHILTGAYAKAGDQFRINVILQDASTFEHIDSESISGIGEDSIFSMVDELTRLIKSNFQLSPEEIASDIDKDIGVVATSSPEAYKYFVEGMHHDNKGDYEKVIESMKKAVEIDPEFASAYLAMSWSYGNLYFNAEKEIALQKALELSDRLTDRERYNIEGQFYFEKSEKTWDKSLEAFKKLMVLYPDDISGNNSLAILYGSLGDRDKAIEHYKVCIDNNTEDVVIFTNLAGTYNSQGLFEKAIEVLESYINNIKDSDFIRRSLASTYRYQGKYDLALAEVDKALSFNPQSWQNIRAKGDVYFNMGDLEKAELEYKKLAEREETLDHVWGLVRLYNLDQFQGKFEDTKEKVLKMLEISEKLGQLTWTMSVHKVLSHVELRLSNPEQAIKEMQQVIEIAIKVEDLNMQREGLRDLGNIYISVKSMDKAEDTLERLRELAEQTPNKELMRDYYYLKGKIELEKKNYPDAIGLIKQGISLLSPTSALNLLYTESLGLVYHRSGDLDNARRTYESVSLLKTGRFSDYCDIYAKSFYMLGKICEQLGETAKAIEHYEKFLDLWKDADTGLSEVDDAKKRLVGLKSR